MEAIAKLLIARRDRWVDLQELANRYATENRFSPQQRENLLHLCARLPKPRDPNFYQTVR